MGAEPRRGVPEGRTSRKGALKKFFDVEKHYTQIFEDQADFHQYCPRKHTMRAYTDMMQLGEQLLHGQRPYASAIRGAVETYLQLFLGPKAGAATHEGDPAEQKKAEQKRKKAEAARKAEEEAAALKRQQDLARANAKRKGRPAVIDPDPNGEMYLKVTDPLAEAAKHLRKINDGS